MYQHRANKIIQRINELAAISDVDGMITRVYGADAFVAAGKKIVEWMNQAGLATRADNIHNIRGRLNCNVENAKTFLIASHFDTVVNAGKFDGPLGIIMGLDIIEHLIQQKKMLPFNIELIAFCDEEGVRFHTTYLGSKVIAGSFDVDFLVKKDKDNLELADCIQKMGGDPNLLANDSLANEDLLGYFEIHIEQGPVLYKSGIPVAVVTAIAGQKRSELIFTGVAGHAGTVPMDMRQDALCCAAACIMEIEVFATRNKNNLVATVGKIDVLNAASNVIPGQVKCTLDIRSPDEAALSVACDALNKSLMDICHKRNIAFAWNTIQETAPVLCDTGINKILKLSIIAAGYKEVELVSGAGHDAVPLSLICPVCMMFVRCFQGISHNPLEDVETKDIAAAIEVSDKFLLNLISTFNN
ncbi:MAG: M20 family metallo-hydrolase [Bacteroidota bacterium]